MSEKPPGPSDTDPRRAETQSTSTTPAEPAVNVFHSTADRDPQIVRQQAATGLSPDDAAESGPAIIPQDATQPNKLSILEKLRKWDPAVELPNKGAVARDHLANEVSLTRTFLAWLRTSLSLASVGVAVTQLFRLQAAVYNDSTSSPSSSSSSSTPSPTPSAPTSTLDPTAVASALASISAVVDRQGQLLTQYAKSSQDDRYAFHQLGKPIGATLIAISIVMLLLGVWRFFLVQQVLTKDLFPPARVSIVISAFLIGSIIVAAFAVILVLQR